MDDESAMSPIRGPLPPPTAAAANAAVIDGDDDSEWEYEYSTTETETHFITLDLSIPEFVRRRDEFIVHNTRGGFRSWLNPINIGDDLRPIKSLTGAIEESPKKSGGKPNGGGEDDGDDEDLGDDSDRDEETKLPGAVARGQVIEEADKPPDEPDPTEIQILNLHSAEPVIAYRGMVFKGAWAENIGTEMLFAEDTTISSNEKDAAAGSLPLPSVMHLPQDVDLLGASSARIACTPTELRDRRDVERADAMKKARRRLEFVIPVPNAASDQRKKQVALLENLMAIKHRHGEEDVVTVQSMDTKHNAVHSDDQEIRRRERRLALTQSYHRRKRRHNEAEDAGGGGAGGGANGTATGETATHTPTHRRKRARSDQAAEEAKGGHGSSPSETGNDGNDTDLSEGQRAA